MTLAFFARLLRRRSEPTRPLQPWRRHGLWAPGVLLMRRLGTGGKVAVLASAIGIPFLLLFVHQSLEVHAKLSRLSQARMALRQVEAVSHLSDALSELARGIETRRPGGDAAGLPAGLSAELAGAMRAEEQAFSEVAATVTADAWGGHDGRLAGSLQRLAEARGRLRASIEPPASGAPGGAPAVGPALHRLGDELDALRAELQQEWSILADLDEGAGSLYEGGLALTGHVLEAIDRGARISQQLLAGANTPGNRGALAAVQSELTLLLRLAEPHWRRAATLGLTGEPLLTDAVQQYQTQAARLLAMARRPDVTQEQSQEAFAGRQGANAVAAAATRAVVRLRGEAVTLLRARLDTLHQQTLAYAGASIGIALLGLLAACYLLVCFHRVLGQGLQTLLELLRRLGSGNLAAPAPSLGRDEIGRAITALGEAVGNLRRLFDTVTQGVAAVSHASREVARGNGGLSARTGEMRSAVGTVASRVQDSSEAMDACADAVTRASEHTRSARGNARRSSKAAQQLARHMQGLEEHSREINQMAATMESLSFQTKLLSLNASVEAARAGEAGRGFAVVAHEVRALAARSATAAGRIRTIVGSSAQVIEECARVADRAMDAVRGTDADVQAVDGLMAEVVRRASDSRAQSQQVLDIARNVENSVAGNVQLIDELSGAAGALRDQGDALRQSVRQFVLS